MKHTVALNVHTKRLEKEYVYAENKTCGGGDDFVPFGKSLFI
jgi:hypothetical protein